MNLRVHYRFESVDSKPFIMAGCHSQSINGSVAGAIIYYDSLPICKRLTIKRFKIAINEVRSIKNWSYDGEEWVPMQSITRCVYKL